MSNLRIAVTGAGIGGLTLCVALGKQSNAKIDLYEAAHEFGEMGAGIIFWYRTWQIMQKLGLQDDLAALEKATPMGDVASFHFRKGDQAEGRSFYDMHTKGGLLPMRRSHFQNTLVKHLSPNCTTHFGKRIVSYDDPASGPITLHFQDGTTAECDLLIGAEGIKSVVRAELLANLAKEGKMSEDEAKAPNPIWTGTVCYRALIPKEMLEAKCPGHRTLTDRTVYFGKNKHLTVYPISKGAHINLIAFYSDPSKEGTQYSANEKDWVVEASNEELLKDYVGWEPEVRALLECVDKSSKWAIHVVSPLSTFVSGRVALLGDSAHAMAPHQASGAGQAIEDGYILSALLASPKCTSASLPRILEIYDQVRRPKAKNVYELTRATGAAYEFGGAGREHIGQHDESVGLEELKKIGDEVVKLMEWAQNTSAEEDREKALDLLAKI